jgi:hypothetical protein
MHSLQCPIASQLAHESRDRTAWRVHAREDRKSDCKDLLREPARTERQRGEGEREREREREREEIKIEREREWVRDRTRQDPS